MLQDRYEEFLKNRRVYCVEKTLKYYADNVQRFINFCNDNDVIDECCIDQTLIEDYIMHLKGSSISMTSIHTYVRAVRSFANWMYEFDIIPVNPFKRVRLPRADPAPVLPLSVEEVKRIDNYILTKMNMQRRNYIIFHLLLDCGLRSGEIVRLRIRDVMPDTGILEIFKSKGNKSRYVPIPPALMNELQRYIKTQHRKNRKDSVFYLESGEPINSEAIKRICSKIKNQTGIDRFHAHLCRHTFATSFFMGGGQMEGLRVLTGHADYEVLKGYLHVAKAMELMNYNIYRLDDIYFRQFNYHNK